MKFANQPELFLALVRAEFARRCREELVCEEMASVSHTIADHAQSLTDPDESPALKLDHLMHIAADALEAAHAIVMPGISDRKLHSIMDEFGVDLVDAEQLGAGMAPARAVAREGR